MGGQEVSGCGYTAAKAKERSEPPLTFGVLRGKEIVMADGFSWPKKGNKAFASASDGAYFHIPSVSMFYPPHAQSFKEAAQLVIDKCEEEGERPANDILVFPVLYLYRHGIELNLKSIIGIGIGLDFFKREDVQDDLQWHNLAKLWSHAKKLLLHRWSTSDPEPLKATEAVINELHQSDPNGQVFRYAADKDGRRHRYEKLPDHISLATLKKTMDGVFNFLEATWSGLEDDLQNILEMRAEWERDMRSEYRE